MVPFGGWEMPVQYTGIIEEHRTVRGAVGLFDISHMGEFEIAGPEALAIVQRLTHQRRVRARRRPGPVLAPLLSRGRHRGRPDALPSGRRPLHAHSQRGQHRQGLGVGHVARRRRRAVDERERGDGAPRRAGAEGGGAGRAARRHGRHAACPTTTSPAAPWRACPRSSRAPATRARTASSSTSPRLAPRALWDALIEAGRARRHPADRPRRARHAAARDEVRALRQ